LKKQENSEILWKVVFLWFDSLEAGRHSGERVLELKTKGGEMSILLEPKQKIIQDYQRSERDTGSSEVQVAVLTERIRSVTAHLQEHPKDFSSRRGLLILVGRRRRFLNYLKKESEDRYLELIRRLNLRR
jgi:small subunit ribosomal protein S15